MRITHRLKIRLMYTDAVFSGDKNFEVRYNDRQYQKGDYVVFQAVDTNGTPVYHKLNDEKYEITYVLTEYQMPGYVTFGIKPVRDLVRKEPQKPKLIRLKCLRCGQAYGMSPETMDEVGYIGYSYCNNCLRAGIKALWATDEKRGETECRKSSVSPDPEN